MSRNFLGNFRGCRSLVGKLLSTFLTNSMDSTIFFVYFCKESRRMVFSMLPREVTATFTYLISTPFPNLTFSAYLLAPPWYFSPQHHLPISQSLDYCSLSLLFIVTLNTPREWLAEWKWTM